MSWTITRIRLAQIGPPTARYEGILDLRDPSGGPASAVALRLVNGGGKGVLLQHLLNVLVPGNRGIIGEDETWKKLGKFVVGGDLAHLAIEWQRDDELLITGKTMRWRHGHPSSEARDLQIHYYAFSPDGLTLDTLPFSRDGHWLEHSVFHRELADALTEHARSDFGLVQTDHHTKWMLALRDRGLDSDLFRYQVRMNHQEGGADRLLTKLKTNEEFLRFFVDMLAEEDELKRLTAAVAAQRKALADRETVAAEAVLFERFAAVSEPLVALAEQQRHGDDAERSAHAAAEAMWLRVRATMDAADAELPGLQAEQQHAAADMTAARTEHNVARLQEVAARRQAAEHALARAQRHVETAKAESDQRALDMNAWQAARPILAVDAERATLEAIRLREQALERDAEPLAAIAERRGSELHAALTQRLAEITGEVSDAETERDTYTRTQAAARTVAEHAAGDLSRLSERLSAAVAAHERLSRRRTGLTRTGDLPGGVAARDHLALIQDELVAANISSDELAGQLSDAEAAVDSADRELRSATQAHEVASREVDQTQRTLTAVTDEVERIYALDGLAWATGMSESDIDLWRDRAHTIGALQATEQRAHAAVATLLAEEHARRDVLERITLDDLVPPDQDCDRVLATLAARDVPSVSGWRYIYESRPPADWPAAIGAAGAYGASVVLTAAGDGDCDTLAADLSAALPDLRRAVPVLDSSSFESMLSGTGDAKQVAVTAGVVDPEAATELQHALQEQLARSDDERERRRSTASTAAHLRLQVQDLLDRRPSDPRPPARRAADESVELAAARDEALKRAKRSHAEALAARTAVTERARALAERQEALRLRAARLEPVADEEARLSAAEHDPDVLRTEIDAADARHRRAQADERAAREQRARLEQAIGDLRCLHGDLTAERSQVAMHAEDALAEKVALDHARTAYAAARDAWQRALTDEQLKAERIVGEQRLAAAQRERDTFDDQVLAAAAQLIADGQTAETIPAGQAAATERFRAAAGVLANAEADATQAEQRVADARQAAEQLRTDLAAQQLKRTLDPDEEPSSTTEEQALTIASAAALRAAQAEQRRASAASREANLRERLTTATQRAKTCRRLLATLRPHPATDLVVAALTDDSDTLENRVETLNHQVRRAEAAAADLREQRAELAKHLRRVAREVDHADAAAQFRATVAAYDENLELADWAATRHRSMLDRAAAARQELEALDRRTSGAVDFYTALVGRFMNLLRRVSRVSQLPEGLGGWSGRSFLSVAMPPRPEPAALRDRAEQTLSAALSSDQATRISGADLLFRGIISGCGGKAPSVRFLKPDIGLPYQPVRLGEGMSGGQGVTAAVALYCTLAALRREALTDGRLSSIGGGALLLDNPFGKTTSAELLAVMFRVAERLGVQLVCFTPSKEDEVLSQFPVLLQLRNSRGVRDGLRHVRVSDVSYRDALAASADGDGVVSARLARDRS